MRCLALVLLLLTACSGEPPAATTATQTEVKPATPPPPAVPQARELIASSAELAEHEFTNAAVSIPVAGSAMNEVTRGQAKELAASGWIAFDGSGDLMLNDRSRSDKRFLLRENGILDVVPIAKKELGEVTAVRANPDGTAAADFTWKWVPNEVGTAFQTGLVADRFAATHNATATLIWDGTTWSVLQIQSR